MRPRHSRAHPSSRHEPDGSGSRDRGDAKPVRGGHPSSHGHPRGNSTHTHDFTHSAPASSSATAPKPADAPVPGLYLIPTPIGNLADLTPRALQILAAADCIACEDTRRTGLLLHLTGLPKKRLICIEAHRESAQVQELIDRLQAKQIVALVSDGGTPCLSDPGRFVVLAAQTADLPIISLPGASAITAAFAASGFPPPWTFYGFIARKGKPRRAVLTTMAERTGDSAILFESPFRLLALLKELVEDVRYQHRPLVLAQEISKIHESFHRGTPAELLTRFSARASIKGEWTVVIGPAAASDPESPVTPDDDAEGGNDHDTP